MRLPLSRGLALFHGITTRLPHLHTFGVGSLDLEKERSVPYPTAAEAQAALEKQKAGKERKGYVAPY